MTSRLVSFVLSNMARGLKFFARLFRIEQVKGLAGAVYKQEKEETKAKSVCALVHLKMPKLEQINSQALRGKFVVYLFCSLYKTNRFQVEVGLFSNR